MTLVRRWVHQISRSPRGARSTFRVIAMVTATITLFVLTVLHVPGVNGVAYSSRGWRFIEGWRLFPALALAGMPFVLAQWWWLKRRTVWPALSFLGLATFVLQWVALGLQEDPFSLVRAVRIIQHAQLTSYFDEAQRLLNSLQLISLRQWFESYPQLLERMYLHARFRPPGPTLYYASVLSTTRYEVLAALLGGAGLAISAAVAPAALFGMMRNLRHDAGEAFAAASLLALTPALVLCFPEMDQLYVLMSCTLVVLWWRALQREGLVDASLFALASAVALFFSYIFLVLGVYFSLSALWWASSRRQGLRRALLVAGLAGVVVASLYLLLWLVVGYSAPAAIVASQRIHAVDLAELGRPSYPWHLGWDAYEFVLGGSWIVMLLLWWWWRDRHGRITSMTERVSIGLAQVVVVFVVGLLPGETARLYLLMYPFVCAAAGVGMAHFSPRARAVVYLCYWAILAAMAQNMTFVT